MEGKLIEKIKLENGLTLELYDSSRPVAGDRWLVSLVARIEIEVMPEYFDDINTPDDQLDAIREAMGNKATYRHEKTRHFIAETEKGGVLKLLKERFLAASIGYLSSADFPRKLILLQYKKAQSQLANRRR